MRASDDGAVGQKSERATSAGANALVSLVLLLPLHSHGERIACERAPPSVSTPAPSKLPIGDKKTGRFDRMRPWASRGILTFSSS